MSRRQVSRGRARAFVAALPALVALIVFAPTALAGTDSIRFEFGQNGTWTVPDRVSEIEVEVAGAGGGGGFSNPDISGGTGALVQASIAVQGGEVLAIGIGGGGDVAIGVSNRGAGGGGASIIASSSSGLTDLLVVAGGGGGAGEGADTARSRGGGSAGANNDGSGSNGGSVSFVVGGVAGASGLGGAFGGNNYVIGSSSASNGAGGARTQFDGTRAAAVGGQGGEAGKRGGNGGAGYGGGGMGNSGTVDSVTAAGGGGAGGSIAQGGAIGLLEGRASYYSSAGGAGGVLSAGGHGWVVITWVIPAPLPDPELPAGAAQREPVVLQLTMPAGVQCSTLQVDSNGPWVRLPAADDCSIEVNVRSGSDDAEPGLLGWATTPNFPVKLAQRQIDNGWGAYETFDSSGDLTAVFIPAGGWAQASSDTNLFPIWAE